MPSSRRTRWFIGADRQKCRGRSGAARAAGTMVRNVVAAGRGARAARECGLLITRPMYDTTDAAETPSPLRAKQPGASAPPVPYDRTLIYSRRVLMTILIVAHSATDRCPATSTIFLKSSTFLNSLMIEFRQCCLKWTRGASLPNDDTDTIE